MDEVNTLNFIISWMKFHREFKFYSAPAVAASIILPQDVIMIDRPKRVFEWNILEKENSEHPLSCVDVVFSKYS